ncbi:hypothetical protein AAY473_008876, partial [Plecturocebus cupreus]
MSIVVHSSLERRGQFRVSSLWDPDYRSSQYLKCGGGKMSSEGFPPAINCPSTEVAQVTSADNSIGQNQGYNLQGNILKAFTRHQTRPSPDIEAANTLILDFQPYRQSFSMLVRLVSNSQPQMIHLPRPPKVLELTVMSHHAQPMAVFYICYSSPKKQNKTSNFIGARELGYLYTHSRQLTVEIAQAGNKALAGESSRKESLILAAENSALK